MEDFEKIMTALGLKLINVVAGAVSAFVALRFLDKLGTLDKWTTFIGGWMLAAWGAPPVREYLEAPPKVEVLFVLLLGLFGMAVTAEVVKLIKGTDWRGILQAFINRKGGGQQ